MERLGGKKNLVFRIRDNGLDIVRKTFTDPVSYRTEKQMGQILQGSGLRTPKLLGFDDGSLTIEYEYIDGLVAIDLVESASLDQAKYMTDGICKWLISFHRISREKTGDQYIWGDAHFRNLIYRESTGHVYGIDFEECRIGRRESDLARLYVFLLNYDPPYTERKKILADEIINYFEGEFALDRDFLNKEIEREERELLERRKPKKEINHENFT